MLCLRARLRTLNGMILSCYPVILSMIPLTGVQNTSPVHPNSTRKAHAHKMGTMPGYAWSWGDIAKAFQQGFSEPAPGAHTKTHSGWLQFWKPADALRGVGRGGEATQRLAPTLWAPSWASGPGGLGSVATPQFLFLPGIFFLTMDPGQ